MEYCPMRIITAMSSARLPGLLACVAAALCAAGLVAWSVDRDKAHRFASHAALLTLTTQLEHVTFEETLPQDRIHALRTELGRFIAEAPPKAKDALQQISTMLTQSDANPVLHPLPRARYRRLISQAQSALAASAPEPTAPLRRAVVPLFLGSATLLAVGLALLSLLRPPEHPPKPDMPDKPEAVPTESDMEQHRRTTIAETTENPFLSSLKLGTNRVITVFTTNDGGATFFSPDAPETAHLLCASSSMDSAPSGAALDLEARIREVWENGLPLMTSFTTDTGTHPAYLFRLSTGDVGVIHSDNATCRLPLYEKIFESTLEGIALINRDGTIAAVNPAFTSITGYSAQEILGQLVTNFRCRLHDDAFYRDLFNSIRIHGRWAGELWAQRKDGEEFAQQMSITAISNDSGETTHYTAVFHDITDIKHKEALITHQAYHDALTGLPNRQLLTDRMQLALSRAKRHRLLLAVIFIDLDNFKTINDSLGHSTGDLLLQAVARRVKTILRNEDTFSRLGGDEFVIMQEDLQDSRQAVLLAARVLKELETPFQIQDRRLFITSSIGISFFPNDGATPDTLIKNADLAMYKAKEMGRNNYCLFTPEMNTRVVRRLSLEGSLRTALERDEFFVLYQPKHDTMSLAVTGAEALVRWNRSSEGIVSPGEFIPLAEETGLIVPLGDYVLETACASAQAIVEAGHAPFQLSVNLSPKQFQQHGIAQKIDSILSRTGFPAHCLELEITESMLISDLDTVIKKLSEITEMGIRLAIDDFGTGYSSLNYLRRLPIQCLKIDQSFVREITKDSSAADLVGTMILLARNFNKRIIAEGVETKEQYNFLLANRCDEIQGFYFSHPLRQHELATYFLRDIPL